MKNYSQKYVITIIDIETFSARALVTNHPETVDEYETTLNENEIMFVNEMELINGKVNLE